MLNSGVKIENFTLPDEQGNPVSLSDFKGKKVIVYFYPKDNTPGCTTEACSFRDEYDEIIEAGAEVLGISPDPPESHREFKKKYNLPFKLLSDPERKVISRFDALGEKELIDDEIIQKIYRSTYIIDENMVIHQAFHKVNPEGHGKEILTFLL